MVLAKPVRIQGFDLNILLGVNCMSSQPDSQPVSESASQSVKESGRVRKVCNCANITFIRPHAPLLIMILKQRTENDFRAMSSIWEKEKKSNLNQYWPLVLRFCNMRCGRKDGRTDGWTDNKTNDGSKEKFKSWTGHDFNKANLKNWISLKRGFLREKKESKKKWSKDFYHSYAQTDRPTYRDARDAPLKTQSQIGGRRDVDRLVITTVASRANWPRNIENIILSIARGDMNGFGRDRSIIPR